MLTWTRIKSLFLIIFFPFCWKQPQASVSEHVQAPRRITTQQRVPRWMERRDRQHRAEVLFVYEYVLFLTILMKHLQSAGPQHAPCHKTVLLLWVPHGRYSAQPAAGVHVVSENERLWAVMSHCSGNNRRTKSVKQVGDLLDGCQQGRFGGALRCVEDPVRGGQTQWAVTEKYRWLQQGLQSAESTWCGHRCKKWELGFLCLGRNMRCLYLNYVLVAQRRPCSWNSRICCRKSLPSYGKDQNIYRKKIKPTEFIEFVSSLLENILQKYLTYLFSATRRYCLCTGWTLTQRRTLVLSEWRDSWEFLCVQILPMKSQESTTQSCCHLIKPQKEIKWETRVLPWGAPINDGNVSI